MIDRIKGSRPCALGAEISCVSSTLEMGEKEASSARPDSQGHWPGRGQHMWPQAESLRAGQLLGAREMS